MVQAARGLKDDDRTELLGSPNILSHTRSAGQAATAERLGQLGKDPMMHS